MILNKSPLQYLFQAIPFITLEDLDAEIEKALSDVKDYNFAIDLDDGYIV